MKKLLLAVIVVLLAVVGVETYLLVEARRELGEVRKDIQRYLLEQEKRLHEEKREADETLRMRNELLLTDLTGKAPGEVEPGYTEEEYRLYRSTGEEWNGEEPSSFVF